MSTIFLCHSSVDKPFVERLAADLERLGVGVWFDRYEIRVGQSILWRIDEGIRDSEYLGVVISKKAWESEWVKTEISSAWQKQVKQHGNFVLPIYYKECEIPLFLQGIKYADFREDYHAGLRDLAQVFGIREIDAITDENWRKFTRERREKWGPFQEREFERRVTRVVELAKDFRFSLWVGGTKSPYSLTVSGWIRPQLSLNLSVRMVPRMHYRYFAAATDEINPNNVSFADYTQEIGSTVDEVVQYLQREMEAFTRQHGTPSQTPHFFTNRPMNLEKTLKLAQEFVQKLDWDQGRLL